MQKIIENFEKEIATLHERGKIRAPIHLRDGNIDRLIEIFKQVKPFDYVFSTWSSHAHAILKGVPLEKLREDILEGNSINLQYPDYNFYSSAIVGGVCPIATGVAYALKNKGTNQRVFVFLGDMTFQTGIAYESIKYSIGHKLPITFIVEDNGLSVNTPTQEAWGINTFELFKMLRAAADHTCVNLYYYTYSSSYPHAGTGVFVEF